jgi:hypothetical protein
MKLLILFLLQLALSAYEEDDPTLNVMLVFRSGEIVYADVIDLEIPGMMGIRTSEGEVYIPLVYLMPDNQAMVTDLKPFIKKPEAQVRGSYGTEFKAFSNFADLKKLQIETPTTALVLIDPSGTFQKTLGELIPRMASLQTDLSWFPKYEYGPDADLAQVDLILKQYKANPPALLHVGKKCSRTVLFRGYQYPAGKTNY